MHIVNGTDFRLKKVPAYNTLTQLLQESQTKKYQLDMSKRVNISLNASCHLTLKDPTQDGGGIPQGSIQRYILCPRVPIFLTED